jgi:hypothetical protein
MSLIEIKDPKLLRERWFDQPLNVIEHGGKIPDGNGAIIALMAVFPLYERYLDDSEKSTGTKWEILLAQDLKLPISPNTADAEQFWNVFRDGLGHTAMFFEQSETARKKKNNWILPKVSLDGKHPDLPVFKMSTTGERVICLNPWGFVRHIIAKYQADPEIFTRNVESPMLSLFLIPTGEVQP